jgi:hypothetical protein
MRWIRQALVSSSVPQRLGSGRDCSRVTLVWNSVPLLSGAISAKELPMAAEKFVRILDAMTAGLLFTYFQTPKLVTQDIIITAFEALA